MKIILSSPGILSVKKNPVKRPSSPRDFVAQWLEYPSDVAEVVGSIPA